MTINEGEIWQVRLGLPNREIIGHEQGENRPCLVIKSLQPVQLATIVPMTGKMHASRFPYTTLVMNTSENGLESPSIAMVFQLKSISYIRFIEKRGNINLDDWNNILDLIEDFIFENQN